MNKVFIIAEAGVNHNGSPEIARKLVDVAADSGADAIKFQTFKSENLVTTSAPKISYQSNNTARHKSQIEMLRDLELSYVAFKDIFSYCRDKNINFLSTPFDEESVDFLVDLGMNIIKIPSGEITNKSLVQHIAKKGKQIILSTGMSYLSEIEKTINWINEVWQSFIDKPQLTLLHCVSDYPAPIEDVNLSAIKTMENAFSLPVGFSDHTMGIEIPIAAVSLGATVIEKHFTLNRGMEGPDHTASLEPAELKEMVRYIRNLEKALGDGIKRPMKSETEARDLIRRSITAKRHLKPGTRLSLDDITVKRPGTGIQPEFRDRIIGMQIKRDVKADSILTWDDFKDA